MLMRFKYLRRHPRVFRSVTGLTIAEFNELLVELRPFFEAHEAPVQTGSVPRVPDILGDWIIEMVCC